MKARLQRGIGSGGRHIAAMSVAVVAIGVGAIVGTYLMLGQGRGDMLWPEPGASYALPYTVGEELPPDPETPSERSQTLQINLADKARLDRLVLKNLDLGKASLTQAFTVERTSGVTGSNAYLYIGAVTITNSSAPTLAWDNIEAGSIALAAKVDGHTQAMTLDQSIGTIVIDSDRGSGSYVAENSVVDRIIISIGANGASVGELVIDDVDASVGAWKGDWIRAGSITMDASNSIGDGTGIDAASFVINTSVKSRSITDNLVDTPISVR